jgi:methionine synthase II (cobalamin-independent)
VKRSVGRILTTHVGSLPRPNDLVELYRDDAADSKLLPRLKSAVEDVVRQQASCGIDIVNDGEFGKAMRRAVDFGAWWSYVYDRLGGFELRQERVNKGRAAWTFGSRERREFADFYAEEAAAAKAGQGSTSSARMYGLTCTGPVIYTGQAGIQRDIQNLTSALGGARLEEAFVTAVSPATLQILPNEYYKSPEDYTWALAEAIREEYKAITDAGFILQIDDPALVDIYDWWFSLNGDLAGYRKWAEFQVEAFIHKLPGQFTDAAAQMDDGIKLYMKEHGDVVAGRKIELVRKDTGGAPDAAKRLAQELIVNDNVDILAGFVITPEALTVADLSAEAKKFMVVMNAATSIITTKSPYITRSSLTLPQNCEALGTWAYQKGRRPSIEPASVRELKAQGLGPSEIAKTLKIGRASVYRALAAAKPTGPSLSR